MASRSQSSPAGARSPLGSPSSVKRLAPLSQRPLPNLLADSVPLPVRLLATAYDAKWRLKPVVTKECVPSPDGGASFFSSLSSEPRSSPHRNRAAKSGDSFRPGRSQSSFGASVQSAAGFGSQPGSPVSIGNKRRPSEPAATTSPVEPKKMAKVTSLPTLANASEDRPSSAGSEADANKGQEKKAPSEGDEREEKPLSQHADEAGVPLDIAKQALDTFFDFVSNPPERKYAVTLQQVQFGHPFDDCTDLGSMDTDAFGKACLNIAECKDFSSLPDGFLDSAMTSADKDGSGDIDFGEFLYFYYKFSFSEEVLIGPVERQIRLAARDHNIPYDEMSKYKYVFDQTDTNKNGKIDQEEFTTLLTRLFKMPKGEQLPEKRAKEMFREACRNCQGADRSCLDFITFVAWYKKLFGGESMDSGESPFEAYYHNIRRVSVFQGGFDH